MCEQAYSGDNQEEVTDEFNQRAYRFANECAFNSSIIFLMICFSTLLSQPNEANDETYKVHKEIFLLRGRCVILVCCKIYQKPSSKEEGFFDEGCW